MKYNFRPLFGICRGFACDVGACKFVASGQVQLTNHVKHTHGKNDDEDVGSNNLEHSYMRTSLVLFGELPNCHRA